MTSNKNLKILQAAEGDNTAPQPTSNFFPRMDWRFKEFRNEGTHCLYGTCVELMTCRIGRYPSPRGVRRRS